MEEGLKNKFSKAKSQNFTGLITLHKEFFFYQGSLIRTITDISGFVPRLYYL